MLSKGQGETSTGIAQKHDNIIIINNINKVQGRQSTLPC